MCQLQTLNRNPLVENHGETTHQVEHKHDANSNQHHTRDNFNEPYVLAEAFKGNQKMMKKKSGEEKRYPQTKGINGKERNTLAGMPRGGGNHQNGRKDWTYTGSPARRKSDTNHKGPHKATRFLMQMNPFLSKQNPKMKQPGQMHAKQEDKETTNSFDPFKSFMQVNLEFIGSNASYRTKQDKNNRKTKDKTERMEQYGQTDLGVWMSGLKLAEGQTGNVS